MFGYCHLGDDDLAELGYIKLSELEKIKLPFGLSIERDLYLPLDDKNYGEKVGVTSSVNCNVETALLEFKDIQKKYQMKGKRVAYHIIQSFSTKDKLTCKQANEIGNLIK